MTSLPLKGGGTHYPAQSGGILVARSFDQIAADHIEQAASIASGLILEEIGEDGHAVANKLWRIVAYLRRRNDNAPGKARSGESKMTSIPDYLTALEEKLFPAYTSGTVIPGHDVSHVRRMCGQAPRVSGMTNLDREELHAAIWLHNLDRAPDLGIGLADMERASRDLLAGSPFSDEAQNRIAQAAGKHHEKEPVSPSPLLTVLQALDQIDRMNALGVLTAATTHGIGKPLYVIRNPFRYELQDDGQPFSVYDDLAGRIMEFPLMVPEHLHYLIDAQGMRDLVAYVRMLAGHICRAHNLENGVEDDLVKALGPRLYELYAGSEC